MVVRRINITLDPDVYDRFIKIAEDRGIKISSWITSVMRKFVEEEEKKMEK